METPMASLPMLSLKEMALRKSVARFFTERDILESINEFPFKNAFLYKLWWQETVEDKVKEKISKLVIPESIKKQMNLIVIPFCMQVLEWEKFIEQCFFERRKFLDMIILKQMCWTSAGAIDYQKTAERIVRLQTLDVATRYEMACGHCLVDFLPLVWKELPAKVKRKYVINKSRKRKYWMNYFKDQLLPIYWAYVLKAQEYKLLEIYNLLERYNLLVRYNGLYDYAFRQSIYRGNKFATEYFFQKLTFEERSLFFSDRFNRYLGYLSLDCLRTNAPYHDEKDVLLYLLSQAAPERQMLIFRDYPGFIFRIFLHWRWHDLFLDKTDVFWYLIPEGSTYDHLIYHIREVITFSYYYFPELIQEFFRRSPNAFRKRFVDECIRERSMFSPFLWNEDKETVKAILRNIDSEDRVRLVGCEGVLRVLTFLIGESGQYLAEFCIREAFPTKEDRERLKEGYLKRFRGFEFEVKI